jgi:hypothetical protein
VSLLHAQDDPRTYTLGPDDQISIRVADAEEISDKPVRIDMSGMGATRFTTSE